MTGLIAFLIAAELLTVVAIDRPFTRGVAVTPDALTAVLSDFGAATPSAAQPH